MKNKVIVTQINVTSGLLLQNGHLTPRLTGRLTVGRNVISTSTQTRNPVSGGLTPGPRHQTVNMAESYAGLRPKSDCSGKAQKQLYK
jgi:hypothetical protein